MKAVMNTLLGLLVIITVPLWWPIAAVGLMVFLLHELGESFTDPKARRHNHHIR